MHRFYASGGAGAQPGQSLELDAAENQHCRQVLRLPPGEPIELIDGRGGRYLAVLEGGGSARVESVLDPHEPALRVTLYQGIPKGTKMDEVVQHATELGACAFVPVRMRRCVAQVAERDGEKKCERWRRIAREAAKQCGRGYAPDVPEVMDFPAACQAAAEHEYILVAWEDAQTGELSHLTRELRGATVALFIGPEGGLEAEEVDSLRKAGARMITLGNRILRTETAGCAAIAALMSACGEWSVGR